MDEDTIGEGWKDFLELCSKIKTPEDFKLFFDLFLTIEEKVNFASRYIIVKALLAGELPQREIAARYKTSIGQITRGSNALKIIDPKLRKFLKANIK